MVIPKGFDRSNRDLHGRFGPIAMDKQVWCGREREAIRTWTRETTKVRVCVGGKEKETLVWDHQTHALNEAKGENPHVHAGYLQTALRMLHPHRLTVGLVLTGICTSRCGRITALLIASLRHVEVTTHAILTRHHAWCANGNVGHACVGLRGHRV